MPECRHCGQHRWPNFSACYWHLKERTNLYTGDGLTSEERRFVGIGLASPSDNGWRPADIAAAAWDEEPDERGLLRFLLSSETAQELADRGGS